MIYSVKIFEDTRKTAKESKEMIILIEANNLDHAKHLLFENHIVCNCSYKF